ncbi:hypothetical protein C8R42DRAFT_725531 [Lentinula raphanica]|nr:hypothetical protein C8R42DRAFT_725531 [Lentinula raphanica]
MNHQQQPQYYSPGFENSYESSSQQLLSGPRPPSESFTPVSSADDDSNAFPNIDTLYTNEYADPCRETPEVDRPLGLPSVDRGFDVGPPEINEELNEIEITIFLTLVSRAQDPPRIVHALDLRLPVFSKGGIPMITALAAVVLAKSLEARLPEELRLALNHPETAIATAGIPPYLSVPVELLPNFCQLASIFEILTIDPFTFELCSVTDYFIPESMVAKPSKANFVLIVQPPSSTGQSDTVCGITVSMLSSVNVRDSPAPSMPQVQSSLPQSELETLSDPNAMRGLSLTPVNSPQQVALVTPPDSAFPTAAPSPSQTPIRARDIDHACFLLEMEKPHGSLGLSPRN